MEKFKAVSTPNAPISEGDIERAISDYLRSAPRLWQNFFSGPPMPAENFRFNIFGQQQYLLLKRFDFTKIPKRVLKRLSVHLVKQFAVQVELDCKWYWALTHDIAHSPAGNRILVSWELGEAFTTLIAAHLAILGRAPSNRAIQRLNRVIDDSLTEPTKHLVRNNNVVLEYLSYPVLESLTKFALTSIVNSNGRVLTHFTDGRRDYVIGNEISQLSVLLRCLERNATQFLGKPNLETDLRDFRIETERIIPTTPARDGWDQIYKLRIVATHGVTRPEYRSALITNLICMLLWHLFDDNAIDLALQRITTRPSYFPRFPHDFYPPIE